MTALDVFCPSCSAPAGRCCTDQRLNPTEIHYVRQARANRSIAWSNRFLCPQSREYMPGLKPLVLHLAPGYVPESDDESQGTHDPAFPF